jgi:hypothetical protein
MFGYESYTYLRMFRFEKYLNIKNIFFENINIRKSSYLKIIHIKNNFEKESDIRTLQIFEETRFQIANKKEKKNRT